MINGRNDSLALDDEDRLPWLEPAYDDSGDDKALSAARLTMFIIAGLALIGLVVGAVYLLRTQISGGGQAELISAPQGDYKIPAKDADAKSFEGEGHASFAASEGIDRGAKIDPARLPETPIIAGSSGPSVGVDKPVQAAAPAKKVEAAVADRTGDRGNAPVAASAQRIASGTIQLGAYGSEALARDAWGRFSKRFDYLADLGHMIEPVTVGGSKFYRLRVAAGKNAPTLCGKLKVAGENCMVVH
ncbi:MAG: SPOR domain-containing protein [Sphingobium sp.]|nr:SPOR domain-containing protein [Sphingobium sp.]